MEFRFRQAICNEAFEGWNFAESCRTIREIGYTGIEIAPFTLADSPSALTSEARAEIRRTIEGEGLTFVGLHWLMPFPKGLHVTTPDTSVREKSWRHVRDLIDLCADLGPGGVMVFGSPKQRCSTGGMSREEATQVYVHGIIEVVPQLQERGVTFLIEPLPVGQCDVVQTLDEAASLVRDIGSPAVQTMFDVHNAIDEVEAHAELVDRHFNVVRHIHVNEMDGRHPGTGDYDFRPVLTTLKARGYSGWVSLESFDFTPGADVVARESFEFLKNQMERLPE